MREGRKEGEGEDEGDVSYKLQQDMCSINALLTHM